MRYAQVWKILAIAAKSGNGYFKPGDVLRESDIDNFDKFVEKESIKIITKAEFNKLYAEQTGQSAKEAPKKEAPKKKPEAPVDPEIDAIKATDLFKDTFKLNKDDIVEKLKEAGFIGEIDTELTKEALAIQVVKTVQANEEE